jgi:tetratricopeptide (TPR) repeat protein
MATPASLTSPSAIGQAINEAATCFRQGKLDQAEKICTRLLKARPDLFDALHILGLVKLHSGKAGAALSHLEAALKLDPTSAQAMSNLAMTLAALGRDAEALATLDKALTIEPDAVEILNGRGIVLTKLNRPEDALAAFERAIALEPRFLGARANRANTLAALKRLDEAVKEFDAILALQPANAETHFNRGTALARLGRSEDALAAFDRALALRPGYPKALINRASALHALNRYQEMLASADEVLGRDKSNADAHHNRALALLATGDYKRGFAELEWRWQRTGMPPRRRLGKPLWLGEYPLGRKTILLHAEQGLGDTIQFARYAPLLARMGARVVLEAPAALQPLLARLDGVAAVVAGGAPLPVFDVQCPLGSLPLALKTDLAMVPADIPYLKASPDRVAKWRAQIETLTSPRIAIAWSGNPSHVNDRNRSIALERLARLFANERLSFVSVQRELRDGDAEVLARSPRVMHVGDALEDFDDTAAVLALADLVISVDTSVVHLAGALGRPLWVLVPFSPDWRWGLSGETSLWYPAARLFRQPTLGEWESVIARVNEELSHL